MAEKKGTIIFEGIKSLAEHKEMFESTHSREYMDIGHYIQTVRNDGWNVGLIYVDSAKERQYMQRTEEVVRDNQLESVYRFGTDLSSRLDADIALSLLMRKMNVDEATFVDKEFIHRKVKLQDLETEIQQKRPVTKGKVVSIDRKTA